MIGEIITGGISLLGGLFGKKKQTTTSTVDYGRMVRDASAAGFNPLTAIRNGGSAGFTTTTSPTISNTPEVLANLGGVLGQALGDKLDPIKAKRREIDTLLADRQLAQLKAGPQIVGGFKQPRYYDGVKVSQQLAPRMGSKSTQNAASVPQAYGANYERTPATRVQYGDDSLWQANPWLPSADTIEQDFGDVAGSIYGIPKAGFDVLWNGYRGSRYIYEKGWPYLSNQAKKAIANERARPQPKYEPPKKLGGWGGRQIQRVNPQGGGW